jgi:hypothetical protein
MAHGHRLRRPRCYVHVAGSGCEMHGCRRQKMRLESETELADGKPGRSCQGSETVPFGDTYPLQQEYFPTSISDHYL